MYVVHHNQPVQVSLYWDPESQQDKVIIITTLIGGVSDAEFVLAADGPWTRMAKIEYLWPATCLEMEKMFVKEIASGFLSCHPKKVALKQDLERIRDSIDDISRGSIDITLLIYVQTVSSSIFIQGKREERFAFKLIETRGARYIFNVRILFHFQPFSLGFWVSVPPYRYAPIAVAIFLPSIP